MIRLYTEKIDNNVIISIDGDIEFDDSIRIDNVIQNNFVNGSKNIILNLKNCEYIDNFGLGSLVKSLQLTKQNKRKFMLCNLSQDCKEIIMMTMLYKQIQIFNNVEDCISSV
ncbi:MAG: hypothetical protein A2Y40_07530 [Candidatus Margulisbacteria bacterium GWF2_35_9]|nr:MAG: hypothetical protein A2Y40_07530 [Candidatus Margulisbacteria bacterium GWF2_35_9]